MQVLKSEGAVRIGMSQKSDDIPSSLGVVLQLSPQLATFLSGVVGRTDSVVSMNQVHGTEVRAIRGLPPFEVCPSTDAIITADKNTVLIVRTADCVPLVLYSEARGVIAAVHAGWRGTIDDIARKTVSALQREYGVLPNELTAYMGPSIRACCYTCSPERCDAFRTAFGNTVVNDTAIDLIESNTIALERAGVPRTSIQHADTCTGCSEREQYYSYRHGDTESCITAIALQ